MFSRLNTKINNVLLLVRDGLFARHYVLKDDSGTYGEMSFHTPWIVFVETAEVKLTLAPAGLFSRTINILDNGDQIIGTAHRPWLSRKVNLTLQTGFKAIFYRRNVFSRTYVWEADGIGEVLQISSSVFSWTDTITVQNSMAPQAVIPMLIFLGRFLITSRRRRRAAH